MLRNKKIFSILAIIFTLVVMYYYSDFKVIESGTVLRQDTVRIERSEIKNVFENLN